MQPQYSQGAAPSHHPPPYAPPEVTQASGGSITSSLRQWRKKDYVEKQPPEQPSTSAAENPSHVARVAPHTYYPRLTNEVCHYQHQYSEYGVPYKPPAPAPVKYSEIVDSPQSQPIEHIAPVIHKHKDKEYAELCNVPPQSHMKQYQDQMPLKQPYMDGAKQAYGEPSVHHQYISKDSQINPFLQKQPQMHQYMQKEPYQQYLPKYSMQGQYPQPYPSETNNFLAHLNKISPRMAQSIINDTHLRDPQISMYHSLDQGRSFSQPQRMYHAPTMHSSPTHAPRNMPQPYNYAQPYNYNVKSNLQPGDPYNRMHQYQHNIPKYPPLEQSIPNISPQRVYNEGMHVNYAPMPPKISPNYPHCNQLEYAQHYQHRRSQIPQEYYSPSGYKPTYIQNHSVSPETDGTEMARTRKSSLKQYLETWVEEDISTNLPDIVVSNNLTDVENMENLKGAVCVKGSDAQDQQPLYVLDTTEIPNENLPHFLHLQQVEKLPDNIRGYYHSANAIASGARRIIIENGGSGNTPETVPTAKEPAFTTSEGIVDGQRKVFSPEVSPKKIEKVLENQLPTLENKIVEIHIIEDSPVIPANDNSSVHKRPACPTGDTVIVQSGACQSERLLKTVAGNENVGDIKCENQQADINEDEPKNMPVIDEAAEHNNRETSAETQSHKAAGELNSRRSSVCSIYQEMEHIHRQSIESFESCKVAKSKESHCLQSNINEKNEGNGQNKDGLKTDESTLHSYVEELNTKEKHSESEPAVSNLEDEKSKIKLPKIENLSFNIAIKEDNKNINFTKKETLHEECKAFKEQICDDNSSVTATEFPVNKETAEDAAECVIVQKISEDVGNDVKKEDIQSTASEANQDHLQQSASVDLSEESDASDTSSCSSATTDDEDPAASYLEDQIAVAALNSVENMEEEFNVSTMETFDPSDTEVGHAEPFESQKENAIFIADSQPENFLDEETTDSYMQTSKPLNLSMDRRFEDGKVAALSFDAHDPLNDEEGKTCIKFESQQNGQDAEKETLPNNPSPPLESKHGSVLTVVPSQEAFKESECHTPSATNSEIQQEEKIEIGKLDDASESNCLEENQNVIATEQNIKPKQISYDEENSKSPPNLEIEPKCLQTSFEANGNDPPSDKTLAAFEAVMPTLEPMIVEKELNISTTEQEQLLNTSVIENNANASQDLSVAAIEVLVTEDKSDISKDDPQKSVADASEVEISNAQKSDLQDMKSCKDIDSLLNVDVAEVTKSEETTVTLAEELIEAPENGECAVVDEAPSAVVYQINDNNVMLQIADELLEINITAQNGRKIIMVKTFSDAIITNTSENGEVQTLESPTPPCDLPVKSKEEEQDNAKAELPTDAEPVVNFCPEADIALTDDVCVYNEEIVSSSTEIETVPKAAPSQDVVNKAEPTVGEIEKENDDNNNKTETPEKCIKPEQPLPLPENEPPPKCLTLIKTENLKASGELARKSPKTKAALKFVEPAGVLDIKEPRVPSSNTTNQKGKTDNAPLDQNSTKPMKKRRQSVLKEDACVLPGCKKQKVPDCENTEKGESCKTKNKYKTKNSTNLDVNKVKQEKSTEEKQKRQSKPLKEHKNTSVRSKHKTKNNPLEEDKIQKPFKLQSPEKKKTKVVRFCIENDSSDERKSQKLEEVHSEEVKEEKPNEKLNGTNILPEKHISVQENSITSSTSQDNEAQLKEHNSTVIQQITNDWDDEPENGKIAESSIKRRLSLQEYNSRKRGNSTTEPEANLPSLTDNLFSSDKIIKTIHRRDASPNSPTLNVNFSNKTYSRNFSVFPGKSSSSHHATIAKAEEPLSSSIELHLPKFNRTFKPAFSPEYLRNALPNDLQTVTAYTTSLIKENQHVMQRFLEQKSLTPEELEVVKNIIHYKRLMHHLAAMKANHQIPAAPVHESRLEPCSKLGPGLAGKLKPPEKRKKKRFRFLYSDDEAEPCSLSSQAPAKTADGARLDRGCVFSKKPRLDNTHKLAIDYSVHQSNSQGQLTLVFKRNFRSDPAMQPFVRLERLPSLDFLAKKRPH